MVVWPRASTASPSRLPNTIISLPTSLPAALSLALPTTTDRLPIPLPTALAVAISIRAISLPITSPEDLSVALPITTASLPTSVPAALPKAIPRIPEVDGLAITMAPETTIVTRTTKHTAARLVALPVALPIILTTASFVLMNLPTVLSMLLSIPMMISRSQTMMGSRRASKVRSPNTLRRTIPWPLTKAYRIDS